MRLGEPPVPMTTAGRRGPRWVVATLVLALLVGATVLAWPPLARHLVLWRVQVISQRPATADDVRLNPFTGRLAIRGLRVLERDGRTPFTDVERLEVQVRPLSLLTGHVWISEAVIAGPIVRVVRDADGFNISDLTRPTATPARWLDVTVDRFALTRGVVTLEDRALSEPRTWTSEQMEIEARNLSTRRGDGTATGRSITAGTPVSLDMWSVRLYPIHLEARVTTSGLDLGLARVYLPADAAVVPERGRATSTVTVTFDATAGLHAQVTGEVRDLVLTEPGQREPVALVPRLALEVSDFAYRNDAVQVGRLELTGSGSVRDPRGIQGRRHHVSAVRASIAEVTWPVTTAGRLDVEGRIEGGGALQVTGRLRPPPDASQLRLRLSRAELAPWAQFLPLAARVSGLAEADLSVDEPLAPAVPARVRGSLAVSQLAILNGRDALLRAQRVEARDLEVRWPERVAIRQVAIIGPHASIARDQAGDFPLAALLAAPAPARQSARTTERAIRGVDDATRDAADAAAPAPPKMPAAAGAPIARATSPAIATPATPAITVAEVLVRDGTVAWHDQAVTPRVAVDFTGLDARVTGAGWPLRGPLGMHAAIRSPGGGRLQVTGRVAVSPVAAELRVTSRDVEIAPFHSYVPLPARIAGRTDLDLAVTAPALAEGRGTVRGSAVISRLDVRDGERTVVRAERAAVTGMEIDWPRQVTVRDVQLERPWILLERDRAGALPLRALLSPHTRASRPARTGGPGAGSATPAPSVATNASAEARAPDTPGESGAAIPVTLGRVVIEDGGVRIVDHRVTPPFALDVQRVNGRADGLSTDPTSRPARIDLAGRATTASILEVRGTVGSLGGPLRLDVTAELQGLAVPRTNSYLAEAVAWEARDGWLTTAVRCRIDGDTLDARTETKLSRLQVARVGDADQARARIGLPLGMIVALMKDSRGDIHLAVPIRGRLSDPRFDLSEAVWSTVRNIAVKAITGPVSLIGRVRFGADSRIERIDIDPIPFAPGRATLGEDGKEQAQRVALFLEKTPDVRMALHPVVSSRDRAALAKGKGGDAVDDPAGSDGGSSRPTAGATSGDRSRRAAGAVPETAREADSAATPAQVRELATRRIEAVREVIRKAGVDPKRLDATDGATTVDDGEGQVRLDLLEPARPGSPGRPDFLRRLFGEASRPAAAPRD